MQVARPPAGRICLVRQGYFPLDTRVRREVQALTQAGHEVDVVCLRRPGQPGLETVGRVTVHRVPFMQRRAGLLMYVLQYGAFFIAAAAIVTLLHLRRPFDLVQVNTMPDTLVFAAVVPKLLGARVLLDLHESMPEFYAVKFSTGLRHPAVRLLAWAEQSAIRFSDFAITCTNQMREAFQSRGARSDRIDVVMNSANEDEFDPSRYPRAEHVNGEFRLICHGTVERIYGIDTIVRAVALLRDEIPGLRLAVYGEGSATGEIRTLIDGLQLTDRVHLAGRWVPIDELVQAIADADVGVVAIRRDAFRDLSHCNKMFDFITMKRPAIVSRTRSVEAYFGDSCFELFEAGDEHDLARAIRELHANPSLRERLVRNASRANEEHRWPHQRRRYQKIVQRLISKPAQAAAGRGSLPVAAIAWDNHQGRTEALAAALLGRAWYLRSGRARKLPLPLRYAVDAMRTWRLLEAYLPDTVLVVTPPVVAPLVAWCWCALRRRRLVVDCHTGAFHSWKWRWSRGLLKFPCRHALVALTHTHEDEAEVRSWGATALLLPDDIPEIADASPRPAAPRPRVVVAGSLDGNEPVAATLEMARLIPEVEVLLTGDIRRVPGRVRQAAPSNAVFTGWLAYPRFLGELLSADAVAVFSTDPHIMNRAAFEAVGLGRPLVLSDLPGLRARFGEAALFSPNEPQAMAQAIQLALDQRESLTARSMQLEKRLRIQHQQALDRLKGMLQVARDQQPELAAQGAEIVEIRALE